MTREEQLTYCKKCDNKEFDLKKGIICKLTGEIADFQDDCPDFTGDRSKLEFPKKIISKDIYKNSPKLKDANLLKDIWNFLIKGNPGTTTIIITLCYIYFIAMMVMGYNIFNPNIDGIVRFGANVRSYTLDGQLWRLVTTLFVHSNMMQILTDLLLLLAIGYAVEPLVSKGRYLYALIFSGTIAGLVNISLFIGAFNIGMSTSCLGLIGLYLFIIISNKEVRKPSKKLLISGVLIFFSILYYFATGALSNIIFWIALFAGVFSGLTFYLLDKFKQYKPLTIFGHVTIVVFISLLSYVFVNSSASQPDTYVKLMTEFSIAEQKALSVYRLPYTSSYNQKLREVNEIGIPNWKICIEKLNEIDKLDELNPYVEKKNQLMKEYCKKRIEVYGYLAKAYESASTEYDQDIMQGTMDIQLQMNKIKLIDEMANSEAYQMQGIKSPFLYMINDNVVSNLNRLNIDKVSNVEWIMDTYSIRQITNKDVQGIIKITIKKPGEIDFNKAINLEEVTINKRNTVRGVPNISGEEFRERLRKKRNEEESILIVR